MQGGVKGARRGTKGLRSRGLWTYLILIVLEVSHLPYSFELDTARNLELESEVREQHGQLRVIRVDMQGKVAELEQV